jgi:chemotaxis-related protein WspD
MSDQAPCWRAIGVAGDSSCPELAKVVHCRNCPVFMAAATSLLDRPAPDEYLVDWMERLAKPVAKRVPGQTVIVFRLGAEWLALPVTDVVEIGELRRVGRVAHRTGGVLEGLVNIRGRLQLVVSLSGLLKIRADAPAAPLKPAPRRLMVIERERQTWVFVADEVHGAHRVEGDPAPIPATLAEGVRGCARGIFTWNEQRVGLLDSPALFAALRRAVG